MLLGRSAGAMVGPKGLQRSGQGWKSLSVEVEGTTLRIETEEDHYSFRKRMGGPPKAKVASTVDDAVCWGGGDEKKKTLAMSGDTRTGSGRKISSGKTCCCMERATARSAGVERGV